MHIKELRTVHFDPKAIGHFCVDWDYRCMIASVTAAFNSYLKGGLELQAKSRLIRK